VKGYHTEREREKLCLFVPPFCRTRFPVFCVELLEKQHVRRLIRAIDERFGDQQLSIWYCSHEPKMKNLCRSSPLPTNRCWPRLISTDKHSKQMKTERLVRKGWRPGLRKQNPAEKYLRLFWKRPSLSYATWEPHSWGTGKAFIGGIRE
jgi:hypothetical protein